MGEVLAPEVALTAVFHYGDEWYRSGLGRRVWDDERNALLALLPSVEGRRVLDVGTGAGRWASELAGRGADVVALDGSRTALGDGWVAADRSRGRLWPVVGDARALPFRRGAFDLVTAVTVLCVAEEREAVVAEMARVARPRGHVLIGELARWSLWALGRRIRGWVGGGPWRRARFWTLRGLRSMLQGAGFRVIGWRGAVFYPRSLACARRLQPGEAILSSRTTVGAAFIAVAGRYETETIHE